MSLSSEHRALLFLGGVLVLGAGTRLYRAQNGPRPDAVAVSALDAQRAAVGDARSRKKGKRVREQFGDSSPRNVRGRERTKRSLESLEARKIVDLNVAPATEITALPHISTALAERIVANRDSLGPFGSIKGLERVSGVGPRMGEKLAKLVTFSGTPRPSNSVLELHPAPPKKRRKK